jgi:hypothetical protein
MPIQNILKGPCSIAEPVPPCGTIPRSIHADSPAFDRRDREHGAMPSFAMKLSAQHYNFFASPA